jgi:hypothetical protein
MDPAPFFFDKKRGPRIKSGVTGSQNKIIHNTFKPLC